MGTGEAISAGERMAVYAELQYVSYMIYVFEVGWCSTYIVGHVLHQFFVHESLATVSPSSFLCLEVGLYVLGYAQTDISVGVRLRVP